MNNITYNCSNPIAGFSLHREGVGTGITVGFGVGVGFIVATFFIFYKFIKRDVYGARVVEGIDYAYGGWLPAPPPGGRAQALWYQKRGIINIISIVVNAIQLSAFAFAPSIPWSQGSNDTIKLHLETIFNAFLFQWEDQIFKMAFWILFGIAASFCYFILPCSGFCMVACKSCVESYHHPNRDEPDLVKSTVTTYKFVAAVTLLLEMFGLTILTLLFTPLNCTYYPDRPPTLDIDSNIICWQGEHVIYAACSVIVLIPLFTWSVVIQMCDHEKGMAHCFNRCFSVGSIYSSSGPDNIETHYKWAFYYSLLKVAIAAGNTFFSHHSYVRLGILLVCDLLIFLLACLIHVNQFRMHNILRRLTILGAVWTVICGFIAQFICDPTQWDSFVIWVIGLAVLFIISAVFLVRMYEPGLTYVDTHPSHFYNSHNVQSIDDDAPLLSENYISDGNLSANDITYKY